MQDFLNHQQFHYSGFPSKNVIILVTGIWVKGSSKLYRFSSWWFKPSHLKYICQIGSYPQVEVIIKNIWNHHLANHSRFSCCFRKLPLSRDPRVPNHTGPAGIQELDCFSPSPSRQIHPYILNLTKTPICKGKSSEPNLHDIVFHASIF